MKITYHFDTGIDSKTQDRIKDAIADAFEAGEILPCNCPTVEATIYETLAPDFQASLSCACDLLRPLYSSTPETEE